MKKIRNTIQRDIVFQAVSELAGKHPTADDIYQVVIGKHPHISRGTVYRNLHILCQMGYIQKVSMENGVCRFDALTEHHAHFQRRNCQRIFDVPLPRMPVPKTMENQGFVIEDDAVLFKGLCPECVKKTEGDNS